MMHAVCPSCHEKGRIPDYFVGVKIKCKKCGTGFLVTPPVEKPGAAAPTGKASAAVSASDGIAVEGLTDDAWMAVPESTAVVKAPTEHVHEVGNEPRAPVAELSHDEASSAFMAIHPDLAIKEYKILTSKDKCFEGKFDIVRLEEMLNRLAHQGWTVKAMITPHLAGFGGGSKEEIVVLLER